jgi:hypothetical protein
MKKFYILLFALISLNGVWAQGCLPEGISFQSQIQVDSFQVNYPGCTAIEGDVIINGPDITNLNGLSVVNSIQGNLELMCVDNLANLVGLNNLTSIGGLLGFWDTYLIDLTGLNSLDSIGEGLSIGCLGNSSIVCNDPFLQNLTGLESLNYIGGNLYIADCQSLTNIDALSALTYVEGIIILANHNLTTLAGLENIVGSSIRELTIEGNTSLTICNMPSICSYLSSPGGEVNIYGNANGCNTPAEIANACGISIPCLPYGNYYFINQADVNSFGVNYPGCQELAGNVLIGQPEDLFSAGISNISNLNGLLNIQSISGSLNIRLLHGLFALSGLDSLNSVGGYIEIDSNDSLYNLIGLNNLSSIGDNLILVSNPYLKSLTGLEGLTSIGGGLKVTYCDTLNSMMGLENLNSIGGSLTICSNQNLISLTGLESLTSIGGDLSIGYNGCYGGNASLTSLAGLDNISEGSINNLVIACNQSLSSCDVQSVCDYLLSPNGTVTISLNAPGCNNPEEVEAACHTSTKDFSIDDETLIFPNPAKNLLIILTPNRVTLDDVFIYNQTGQKVLHRKPVNNTLDISKLPPGMYIIELLTNQGKVWEKLIVE